MRALLLLALAITLPANPAFAQATERTVYASVVDKNDAPVTGLSEAVLTRVTSFCALIDPVNLSRPAVRKRCAGAGGLMGRRHHTHLVRDFTWPPGTL